MSDEFPPQMSIHDEPAIPIHSGDGCPLVIVDDEAFVLSALRRVLRSSGFRVVPFTSPREALAYIEANDVHVVLSDFRMPEMDGVELLHRARELRPLAQRVMLTGYADPHSIEEAVNRSEVFRFITKPWDDKALTLTLQAAADECHTRAENQRLAQITAQQNAALRELTHTLEQKVEARTRELAALELQWTQSLDAVADPVAVIDSNGTVLRANRAFREEFAAHRQQVAAAMDLALAQQTTSTDGPLQIDNRLYRLRTHAAGDGIVCIFNDVTAEADLERRMRRHEKMVAMGQLAGGVAHEINSPLAGILSFAQLLSREPGRSRTDLEALGMIEKAARRAARIVDSLLRFARMPAEQRWSPVDLAAVVDDAIVLLSVQLRDASIELHNEVPREALVVRGNSGELHQVVLNLLRNACQAIGQREGTIRVRYEMRGSERSLTVEDDGPGIPPELLDRIFDPFFTTKPEGEGTGLGLSICYRIMESHHGRIEVESKPGKGATFRLLFPSESNPKGLTA